MLDPRTPNHSWLSEYLKSQIRPVHDRKIGIEIERIGMWEDFSPFCYNPKKGQKAGAENLLLELNRRHKFPLIKNSEGRPLGLASTWGKVSLEPGSQVEFSSDPFKDLHTVKQKVDEFEGQVAEITSPWGLHWIGLGVNPIHAVSDIDLIPSSRYDIMTDYLGKKDTLGTSMMKRTSSIQINLDYTSELEAIEMLRVSMLVAPISYALFANSAFLDGKASEYLSFRGNIWLHTDKDRTGLIPESFESGFNFESYAKYLWHRPLMFAQDTKLNYVNAQGNSLNDIALGRLEGVVLSEANQLNGIRELFTEARLKPGYVEVRSIDGLLPAYRYAAAAFWLGLLYSQEGRNTAFELLGKTDGLTRDYLFTEVLKTGLKTKFAQLNIQAISENLVEISHRELKNRGFGEESLLEPIIQNVKLGENPSSLLLKRFNTDFNNDIKQVVLATRQTAHD